MRRDQANSRRKAALDAALLEGLESGVSEKNIEDIWKEAELRYKKKNA